MKNRSPIDRLDSFGEDRVLGLSVKSLIAVGMTIAVAVSGYGMLKRDIEIAKELPIAPVSLKAYELQQELIEQSIITTQQDIESINSSLQKIDERLYNLSRK